MESNYSEFNNQNNNPNNGAPKEAPKPNDAAHTEAAPAETTGDSSKWSWKKFGIGAAIGAGVVVIGAGAYYGVKALINKG
jgi:hypothetical protein